MNNVKTRHDAAVALMLNILDTFPNCVTLPEFAQVNQRQLDLLRAFAFGNNPIGVMQLYIEAVAELDDLINSMDYEERETLRSKVDLNDFRL